jgi:hypothetical protein
MNKEQIYDAQISPLMTQIIAICKAGGISMLAHFDISHEDDPGLACTTCLPGEDGELAASVAHGREAIMRNPNPILAFTITKGPPK